MQPEKRLGRKKDSPPPPVPGLNARANWFHAILGLSPQALRHMKGSMTGGLNSAIPGVPQIPGNMKVGMREGLNNGIAGRPGRPT